MRTAARLLLLTTVLTLALGPVLAAAPVVRVSPTLGTSAPGPAPLARALTWLAGGVVVFGAIRIKDTASLAKKFVTRAGAATADYTSGIQGSGADWETNAKNSEPNFEQGIQQAIADKRFGKGITAAGGAKFVQKATTLGSSRYGPGVQASADDWSKGVAPYLDALKSMDLPPKGPKRSPQNQQRAAAVALKLGALKTGK